MVSASGTFPSAIIHSAAWPAAGPAWGAPSGIFSKVAIAPGRSFFAARVRAVRKIKSGSEGLTSSSGLSAAQASSIFLACVGSKVSALFEFFELLELLDFEHSSSKRVMRWISLGKSTWGESVGFAVEGSCLAGAVGGLVVCCWVEGVRGEQPRAAPRMAVLMVRIRHRSGVGGKEGMGVRMVDVRVGSASG